VAQRVIPLSTVAARGMLIVLEPVRRASAAAHPKGSTVRTQVWSHTPSLKAAPTCLSAWPRRSLRLGDLEQIPDPRTGYLFPAEEPARSPLRIPLCLGSLSSQSTYSILPECSDMFLSTLFFFSFFFFFFCSELGTEPRALHLLATTTELNPQPSDMFLCKLHTGKKAQRAECFLMCST